MAARSVNKIEPFLSKELPIYRDMKKWSLKRLKALKQRWKKKKKVSMSRVEKEKPLKECRHGQMTSKVDHQSCLNKNFRESTAFLECTR